MKRHKCAVAICREQLTRGVLCSAHWQEVPGWLRGKIAIEREELRKAGVHHVNADPELCRLYRLAIEQVNALHARRLAALPTEPQKVTA